MSYVIHVEFELGSKLLLPTHISSHPPPSNNAHHPPSSADRSLHGAVLGQWPPSKADHLDAIAARVPPLVALVAGQVVRGSPFRGKAACSSVSSCFGVHAISVAGAQGSGYHRGEKSHVLSPDPVLQSWGGGRAADWEGRREAWSGSCLAHSGLCLHLASEWGPKRRPD